MFWRWHHGVKWCQKCCQKCGGFYRVMVFDESIHFEGWDFPCFFSDCWGNFPMGFSMGFSHRKNTSRGSPSWTARSSQIGPEHSHWRWGWHLWKLRCILFHGVRCCSLALIGLMRLAGNSAQEYYRYVRNHKSYLYYSFIDTIDIVNYISTINHSYPTSTWWNQLGYC